MSLTDDFADASNLVAGSIKGGQFLDCGLAHSVLKRTKKIQMLQIIIVIIVIIQN